MADTNEYSTQDPTNGLTLKTTSHLGATIEIKGELQAEESLTISGRFEGSLNLRGQDLIIAAGAEVRAEINARSIIVQGRLKGNIHASNRVSIESRAQVTGDITGSSVSIQEGARFKGSVRMLSPQGSPGKS